MFKFLKDWISRSKKTRVIKEHAQYVKQNSETRAVIHTTRSALDTLILELNKKKASNDG